MIKECSEERYDEMLGILPPAVWLSKGFLVGEPCTHRTCRIHQVTRPTYASFFQKDGKFYEGDDLTLSEFLKFDINTLPAPK